MLARSALRSTTRRSAQTLRSLGSQRPSARAPWWRSIGAAGVAAASMGMVGAAAWSMGAHSFVTCAEETEQRRELYPEVEPYRTGKLRVDDIHEIYFEESGNPEGVPVVVLHGGPGGGSSASYRRFFDPKTYRIIQFDQRGCGRSTPHASLENNTTWDLVGDIERLRRHLGLESWHVFGGSWGSTLSLTYAVTHPNRVVSMVLRGIFMLRRHELEWYYQEGASYIFPDAWEKYVEPIPEEERGDMMAAYRRKLTGKDKEEQLRAAKAWTTWEMSTSTLLPPPEAKVARGSESEFALAFARIENHYFTNGGFFPSDQFILENVSRIRNIPTTIVQGRYDVVCPMRSAWDLHRAFPEADLKVVSDAGHSAAEPGITSELVKATDHMSTLPLKKPSQEE